MTIGIEGFGMICDLPGSAKFLTFSFDFVNDICFAGPNKFKGEP